MWLGVLTGGSSSKFNSCKPIATCMHRHAFSARLAAVVWARYLSLARCLVIKHVASFASHCLQHLLCGFQ